MRIQINSDKNISTSAAQAASFREDVDRLLARYADHITRVEAHLSDEDGPKNGRLDKRCAIEVRPKGKEPISVTHSARKIDSAVRGAAQKMQRQLETVFGKKAAAAKRESGSIRSAAASKASIAKAHRVEELLSQLLDEAPQASVYVKAASQAVERALKMIEPTAVLAGKISGRKSTAKNAARSKKKTPIYQMRRKPAARLG